jgi:DNA-binding NarL/FixJ family response regulator
MSEAACPHLTPAQHRILARLLLGESDKQIAAALGLATKSVSNQLARVYRALAFADAGSPRVAAAVWYFRQQRGEEPGS